MSRRSKVEVTEVAIEEVERVPVVKAHVTVHLDRDLNDPRNRPETKPLPSLDE